MVHRSPSHGRECVVLAAAMCVAMLAGGCVGIKSVELLLFNGKDLTGFKAMRPENSAWQTASEVVPGTPPNDSKFVITPGSGILTNGPEGKTSNLYTEMTHADCEAHIEFMVPKGSNSGVYFMGKYEIQILDSFGTKEVTFSDCGGIYARWINDQNVDGHAPLVNASKAPGQWQTFDVVFLAPRFDEAGNKTANACFVKVVHNGKVIHENVELKGLTRAGMPGPEQPRGPLMLQGDHGPVAYRNLRIKPLD